MDDYQDILPRHIYNDVLQKAGNALTEYPDMETKLQTTYNIFTDVLNQGMRKEHLNFFMERMYDCYVRASADIA